MLSRKERLALWQQQKKAGAQPARAAAPAAIPTTMSAAVSAAIGPGTPIHMLKKRVSGLALRSDVVPPANRAPLGDVVLNFQEPTAAIVAAAVAPKPPPTPLDRRAPIPYPRV